MITSRIALVGLIAAAGLGVSACATDGYYGGAYGGYYGDYYDYDGGYWGDGYYGPSYYGWYGDYYYPGSGVYVYDRYRNRHRWNDHQRRYWQDRGHHWNGSRPGGGNWDRFDHYPGRHQGDRNGGHWSGGHSGGGHWNGGQSSGSHWNSGQQGSGQSGGSHWDGRRRHH
jgi:hypothetical protein